MKFLKHGKDGGFESTVDGYWLFEIKSLFSIVLLKFNNGSRDSYHSHAFNSVSWLLKGKLLENNPEYLNRGISFDNFEHTPSLKPIVTRRTTFHKVISIGTSWVFSFRGPWSKTWDEYNPVTKESSTLTYGRKIISKG